MKDIISVHIRPNTKYIFACTYDGKELFYEVMQSKEIAVLIHNDGDVSVYPFNIDSFVEGDNFAYYEHHHYHTIKAIRNKEKLETYIENIMEDYDDDREEAIKIIANCVKNLPDFYLSEDVKEILSAYL